MLLYRLPEGNQELRHGVFLEEEFLSKENSWSKVTIVKIQDPLPDALSQTKVK
jgi:hypothetical protein